MKILIVDGTCPKPYNPTTLAKEPLGGTEATVVRVAEGLAAKGEQVRVTQHNRTEKEVFGAEYTPFKTNDDFKATHVVVLRAPLMLRTARKQYPNAKLFLWCHDLFNPKDWTDGAQALIDSQAVPIFVSDWHKDQFKQLLQSINFKGDIPTKRIYNPIADELKPDETIVDKNKMVFFSSPHKGLARTIEVFKNFQAFPELKDVKLHISNPGYFENADYSGVPNLVNLGQMSHDAVIKEVRSAFAVLHLNDVFPETFGLVHAECNAVGTPFLSSKFGANNETLDHPQEIIDVKDNKAIIDRLVGWKTMSRPRVRANSNFRLSRVLREWKELLAL